MVIFLLVLLLALTERRGSAQETTKPLDNSDSRLTFSFPIQPGGKALEFKVILDKQGVISGLTVRREGETEPFQVLPKCGSFPDQVGSNWNDHELSLLVAHADLNFDGLQDLELLQNYIPHLDKKVYCVYLWDSKTGRFSESNELGRIAVNLEVHPENKTLTSREDWQGGAWQESRYRWNRGKLELTEQASLLGDWDTGTKTQCGFTLTCTNLIGSKVVTTFEKPVCTQEEMDKLPDCPTKFHDNVLKSPDL